jgi:hypothetical protein
MSTSDVLCGPRAEVWRCDVQATGCVGVVDGGVEV